MKLPNSIVRSVGRVSVLAIVMMAAIAFTVLSLIISRDQMKLLHTAKNWLLLVVAVVGFFAVFRSSGIKAQPQRSVLSILLLAVLAYVSLQDIIEPGYVLSPLTLTAPVLQLLILLVFVAPLIVRSLGFKLPDLPSSGVMSYPYGRR